MRARWDSAWNWPFSAGGGGRMVTMTARRRVVRRICQKCRRSWHVTRFAELRKKKNKSNAGGPCQGLNGQGDGCMMIHLPCPSVWVSLSLSLSVTRDNALPPKWARQTMSFNLFSSSSQGYKTRPEDAGSIYWGYHMTWHRSASQWPKVAAVQAQQQHRQ